MNENDSYVAKISEKIENISDSELKNLVTRLIDERNYLSEIVQIDPLTGLYNRRILPRIRKCSAVVMFDIDDFKDINDSLGHDAGDNVIQKIGQIIKNNTRLSDYVCRTGGDEFLIAFTDCSLEVVSSRVEKICKEITDSIELPNLHVTLSGGIASNKDNESIEELMKKADIALYKSKKEGKNRYNYYEE